MVALSVSQAIPAVGGEKGTIPRGIVGFGRVGGRGAHEDLLRLCRRKTQSPTRPTSRRHASNYRRCRRSALLGSRSAAIRNRAAICLAIPYPTAWLYRNHCGTSRTMCQIMVSTGSSRCSLCVRELTTEESHNLAFRRLVLLDNPYPGSRPAGSTLRLARRQWRVPAPSSTPACSRRESAACSIRGSASPMPSRCGGGSGSYTPASAMRFTGCDVWALWL